jgi:hypothetical protein
MDLPIILMIATLVLVTLGYMLTAILFFWRVSDQFFPLKSQAESKAECNRALKAHRQRRQWLEDRQTITRT